VRLIGQLGDQRQVITAEAIGVVVVISLIYIGPGEGDAVEFLLAGADPGRKIEEAGSRSSIALTHLRQFENLGCCR